MKCYPFHVELIKEQVITREISSGAFINIYQSRLIIGDIEKQTLLILEQHFDELSKHNLRPENVVKAGVWLTERHDFQSFDSAYAQAFGDHRPARATVISQLAIRGALIEIDLVASFDSIVG